MQDAKPEKKKDPTHKDKRKRDECGMSAVKGTPNAGRWMSQSCYDDG
jgi:hypothetical protein